MAIQGTRIHTCSHGSTYANVDEWIAAHGYCGTNTAGLVSGTLTLNPDGQSVTSTLVWEDEAAMEAWKANRTANIAEYVTTKGSKETV